MTREEAITYLKVIWNRYKAEYEIERETLDAYHMAIDALKGGDAKMDNCQVQAPQNYMQQSRHNDGTDLISRADAIEAVCKAVCEDDVPIFPECDQIKYCDEIQALLALPSADAVSRENCDQCKIDQVGVLEQQLAELRGDYETLKKAYEEALSNDVEWIPITTSEPTTSNHVLVTYKWGEDDYEVSELDYWVTKYEAENGNAQCKRLIDHVIAWRYMLAPYRGGDAE